MERTVLCYGDSNTYGTVPMHTMGDATIRYETQLRWPGILRRELGDGWQVIEEGLPGRTTVHNDPIEGEHKNGRTYLKACLESHGPIDLVILMLGTNDLKPRFSVTAADITYSVARLIDDIKSGAEGRDGAPPVILLVAPPPINEVGLLGEIFDGGARKSIELARRYERIARERGVLFFDAGRVVTVSAIDGVHLDEEQHSLLAAALLREIVQLAQ